MIRLLRRIFKNRKITGEKVSKTDALLALITAFRRHGKKLVSLGEVQGAAMDWQRSLSFGYSFSEDFLYSYELFEDLSTLEYEGDIFEVAYMHDGYLPKSFVAASETGLIHGQQILENLSPEHRAALESAVDKAVQHYYNTWRLWSRPDFLLQKIPDECAHTS